MKLALLSLLTCFAALGADTITLQIQYLPAGAVVTLPAVGPGHLEVQRSTDLTGTNWTTFAVASNPYPWLITWRFEDSASLGFPIAFYRAVYTAQEPVFP